MTNSLPNEREAEGINELMVRQMEQRRRERQERRKNPRPAATERRRVCSFCFQEGDHPTAAHCRRALER
jgi:hypothetical protein